MSQLVLQPTRKANILHIILTTVPSAHGRCHVKLPVSTSDHCTVVCAITAPPRVKFATKPASRFLNFRRADNTEIGKQLASINWKTLLSQSLDVTDMWLRFSETINFVINKHVPRAKFQPMHVAKRHRKLFLTKKRRWKKRKNCPTERSKYPVR